MSYCVYLLRCADGSLYTGITTDLARRFAEHAGAKKRGAKYTAAHRPLRLEAAWAAADRSHASKLEYQIKALSRTQKELLLAGNTPAALDLSAYTRLPVAQCTQR